MDTITLELRSQLRSLNAYISLINNIDVSRIKVKLLENAIEIQIEDETYNLPLCGVKLLPSSLSSLGITNRWIFFRIQTQPNSIYGTFETELINSENKSTNFLNITNKVKLPPQNVNCKLICICCKNEVTKTICFQRILPLPSVDCDPQEWFCCKHSNDEPFSLNPGESDLFYSINYSIFNKNIFKENLKLRKLLIHCSRCFTILGSSNYKNLKSIKIWNCCIEYKISNNNTILKGVPPLTDFLSTIKHTAELITGEKILLEAQDVNSIHYILLRPMEAKLNLFTEEKLNSKNQILNLNSSFVVKILYKYGESNKTTKHNDPDIKYCELALPSILAGMDQLVNSSIRFPPVYRKADDFYIGYLPM
ncbi:PREDICTED: uncharacterized protein LOC105359150 [Ceratosolen solmsi marchali]|uniref:E3 ubiquitin-protein ligase E3D n=1 Tax=Ceratosolen solmsi marchali TaxID=326594 RepID=A0AAJ6VKD9_9HYME|nr:PREDICTED: uncharacterized protein LOC105359150 [Ceratosolen solmsi marchali]